MKLKEKSIKDVKADYNEEDRIEDFDTFSHCRCRNRITDSGGYTCRRFEEPRVLKYRRAFPINQRCQHITNVGYCELSRMDEALLIKSTPKNMLHLITDRVVTENGVAILKQLLFRDFE